MKNNSLLGLLVIITMALTPSSATQTILVDKRDKDGKTVNKPIELVIPKQYYNALDTDKIREDKPKIKRSHKKEYVSKPYDAGFCRGNTYYSTTNIRKRQR